MQFTWFEWNADNLILNIGIIQIIGLIRIQMK